MTPDSLEAAQRAVPLGSAQMSRAIDVGDGDVITLLITVPAPDYPALAAAARKWIKAHFISEIERWDKEWGQADEDGLAALLADVAKALGL